MLQDQDTYTIVKKNHIANIEKNLNNMLKKWLQKEFILRHTYFLLFSSDCILSKAYDIPKIHLKKNHLYKIVSSINTALFISLIPTKNNFYQFNVWW